MKFMDLDEHIQAHLVSVWGEEKKFLKRGVEGMFFLTEKHLMFVTKTEAKMKWWETATSRQLRTLLKSNDDIMTRHDGYGEDDLRLDLENNANLEISFDRILKVDSEEKPWAPVLKIEINMGDKTTKYHFSIVGGWVKYPLKDPVTYIKVDWTPFVEYIKNKQKTLE
jgi:hypothetical protein